jgi:phage terminase large subunit-like protein
VAQSRRIRIIRELIADPTTVITRGSTYDNRINLAPGFLAQIIKKYEGTRLGRGHRIIGPTSNSRKEHRAAALHATPSARLGTLLP